MTFFDPQVGGWVLMAPDWALLMLFILAGFENQFPVFCSATLVVVYFLLCVAIIGFSFKLASNWSKEKEHLLKYLRICSQGFKNLVKQLVTCSIGICKTVI